MSAHNSRSENRLGEGDSPIFLPGHRKIGTVPDGFQKPWLPLATALVLALVGVLRLSLAQTVTPPPGSAETPATPATEAPPANAKPSASDSPLDAQQAKLAAKYKDLERVFLRMAEVMQTTDPKRAALLRQAFAQSQEHGIDGKYADLVKLLKDTQLSQATKGQATVQQDLNRLLDLLVSGDRDKQIPNERGRSQTLYRADQQTDSRAAGNWRRNRRARRSGRSGQAPAGHCREDRQLVARHR